MPIDYQQQIKEIFGTSDLEELRELAKMLKINNPNPRNAGRKAQLTPDQTADMSIDVVVSMSIDCVPVPANKMAVINA